MGHTRVRLLVKNFLLRSHASFSVSSSSIASWQIRLAPPPYESGLFDSADSIQRLRVPEDAQLVHWVENAETIILLVQDGTLPVLSKEPSRSAVPGPNASVVFVVIRVTIELRAHETRRQGEVRESSNRHLYF